MGPRAHRRSVDAGASPFGRHLLGSAPISASSQARPPNYFAFGFGFGLGLDVEGLVAAFLTGALGQGVEGFFFAAGLAAAIFFPVVFFEAINHSAGSTFALITCCLHISRSFSSSGTSDVILSISASVRMIFLSSPMA